MQTSGGALTEGRGVCDGLNTDSNRWRNEQPSSRLALCWGHGDGSVYFQRTAGPDQFSTSKYGKPLPDAWIGADGSRVGKRTLFWTMDGVHARQSAIASSRRVRTYAGGNESHGRA